MKQATHKPGSGPQRPDQVDDPDQVDELGGLYRSLLASTLDPMVVIDPLGQILFVSNSVERVFGYQAAELVGQTVFVQKLVKQRGLLAGWPPPRARSA